MKVEVARGFVGVAFPVGLVLLLLEIILANTVWRKLP